jgi:hypothetical protein
VGIGATVLQEPEAVCARLERAVATPATTTESHRIQCRLRLPVCHLLATTISLADSLERDCYRHYNALGAVIETLLPPPTRYALEQAD